MLKMSLDIVHVPLGKKSLVLRITVIGIFKYTLRIYELVEKSEIIQQGRDDLQRARRNNDRKRELCVQNKQAENTK